MSLTASALLQPAGEVDPVVVAAVVGDATPAALSARLDAYLDQAYALLGALPAPGVTPPAALDAAAAAYALAKLYRAMVQALAVRATSASVAGAGTVTATHDRKTEVATFQRLADARQAEYDAAVAAAQVPPLVPAARRSGTQAVRARTVW